MIIVIPILGVLVGVFTREVEVQVTALATVTGLGMVYHFSATINFFHIVNSQLNYTVFSESQIFSLYFI